MLTTLLTAPDATFIYPRVRKAVAWLAGLGSLLALASAATALLELALAFFGLLPPALLAGAASQLCLQLFIICLGLLTPWCLHVLVAGRGNEVTRWLSWFCLVLALLFLACVAYTTLTFEPLMIRQAFLPLLLLVLLSCIILFNLPRMAAASCGRRIALAAAPLLLLFACLSDMPGTLLFCAAAKLLCALILTPLLRELRHMAPLIISMPELIKEPPPRTLAK